MSLKALQVADAIRSGTDQKLADGNNLYLVVRKGRGFWVLQYRDGKKIRSKGLGPAAKITPAQARRAREEFIVAWRQTKALAGANDLSQQEFEETPPRIANGSSSQITAIQSRVGGNGATDLLFGEAVERFIVHRAHMKGWKGGVSGAEADSYRRTLIRTSLAQVPITALTTVDILQALRSMPGVTAEKTRTRIACVLDWAKAMGYRDSGDNLARRRGHMEYLLGAPPKAKHHAALPWDEVPTLIQELRTLGSVPANALQWTILTAARAGETLGAQRSEIKSPSDFARLANLNASHVLGEVWVVPAERMKEGKEHHVPLSREALEIIAGREGKLFPGNERQMLDLLNKLRPGFTVHGFRSTFTDWAAEHDYSQELRELALAHAVWDSVEQAYRRSTRLNKRREMMTTWSLFAFGKLNLPARQS
jgi:integrase